MNVHPTKSVNTDCEYECCESLKQFNPLNHLNSIYC